MKSFKELKAQFKQPERMQIMIHTPDQCLACGLKTDEWLVEHNHEPEFGWLMVTLPNAPGIALLGCPKCGTVYFNPNAVENIKIIQAHELEEQNRKVAVASGLLDPSGRPVQIRRG